jgi:hypothetical protein
MIIYRIASMMVRIASHTGPLCCLLLGKFPPFLLQIRQTPYLSSPNIPAIFD